MNTVELIKGTVLHILYIKTLFQNRSIRPNKGFVREPFEDKRCVIVINLLVFDTSHIKPKLTHIYMPLNSLHFQDQFRI